MTLPFPPRCNRRSVVLSVLAWAALGEVSSAQAASEASGRFQDPLDFPAVSVATPSARPLMAVTTAGPRLVAVGSRGLIVVSTDAGRSWRQSQVPVQSDLLAVHFPSASRGWAVGHDGIVLSSVDGGLTWKRQLDGRVAQRAFAAANEKRAGDGDASAVAASKLLAQNFKAGASLPYLDVWFADERTGYVVGSFGMLIETNDGGATWSPWLDRIDDGQGLNLNAIHGVAGEIYIAAERGQVFRLDVAAQRFRRFETGYTGSLFGLAGNEQVLLAYGLRGAIYRSADQGRQWSVVKTASESTITGGAFVAERREFVLVDAAGQVLVGDVDGQKFKRLSIAGAALFTGVACPGGNVLTLSSTAGVRSQPWPTS